MHPPLPVHILQSTHNTSQIYTHPSQYNFIKILVQPTHYTLEVYSTSPKHYTINLSFQVYCNTHVYPKHDTLKFNIITLQLSL